MNVKSMTDSSQARRSSVARADHDRLAEPGRELGFRKAFAVRPDVEELERVGGADVLGLLLEAPGVGERCDALVGRHGEVMAALPTDAQSRLQLVVAVVRAARGQVFGCRFPSSARGSFFFSIETSIAAFGHGASLGGYSPSADSEPRELVDRSIGCRGPSGRRPPRPHARTPCEERLRLVERQAIRLGHERRELDDTSSTSQSNAT